MPYCQRSNVPKDLLLVAANVVRSVIIGIDLPRMSRMSRMFTSFTAMPYSLE